MTPPPLEAQLAADLEISAVTLNQGVGIDLVREGVEPDQHTAPVIASRPGLLRVHVRPGADWEPRPIVAELTLRSGDEELVLQEELEPEEESEPADPDSTFDFLLSAELIEAETRISVRLWEGEPDPSRGGNRDGAAWPPLGDSSLRAEDWGGVLRVVLVPVRYEADGSGRLPDTSDEQLQEFEDELRRLYPVREVEVSVTEVYPTDWEFLPDGSGFGDVLSEMRDHRQELEVPYDTYVFAVVNPRDSYSEFCSLGCTAGLAYRVGNPNNGNLKVGIGLGYSGNDSAKIMAHEVGHMHDRAHAPCGNAGNQDPNYPHEDGLIGPEGWDILGEERVDPEDHHDIMGYCGPKWISDYTYAALHQRITAVEGLQEEHAARETQSWLSLAVDSSGRARFERRHQLHFIPEGESWTVDLLDSRGRSMGSTQASYLAFWDGPGGTLVVPDPGFAVAAVQLPGQPPLSLLP